MGGLIQKTFAVWWRNALRFAGLALLVFMPVFAVGFAAAIVISIAARRGAGSPLGGTWAVVVPFIPLAVTLPVLIVQMGGLTYGAVQDLAGRPVRFGAMLATGTRRAIPLLATGFLMYLAMAVGLVLLVIPGVIVGCALSVAIPAVVVEQIGPIQALRRSWTLTRDHRITVLAAGLVLTVLLVLVNALMKAGMSLFGPLAALVLVPGQLFIASLPILLPAVAYHDLRVGKEGADTSDLAKVFE